MERREAFEKTLEQLNRADKCQSEMISIASQLSQAVEKEELSDNVITALHGCVSASKHILDTIRLAVKYWDNTAQMCSQIQEAKKLVGDDLEDMKGPLEDKLVKYNEPAFMETMARYLGRWQAMTVFSSEFKGHLEEPLLHLRHALTLNPTLEQGQEALTQLAPKLERLSIKEKACSSTKIRCHQGKSCSRGVDRRR